MDTTSDRLSGAAQRVKLGGLIGTVIPLNPDYERAVDKLAWDFTRFAGPELFLLPIARPFIRVGRADEAEYHWFENRHRPVAFAYLRFAFRVSGYGEEEILMQAMDGSRVAHSIFVDWHTQEGIARFWDTTVQLIHLTRLDLWKAAIDGRIRENIVLPKHGS